DGGGGFGGGGAGGSGRVGEAAGGGAVRADRQIEKDNIGAAGRAGGRGGAGVGEAASGGAVCGCVRVAGHGGIFCEAGAEIIACGEGEASQHGGEGEIGHAAV